MLDFIIMELIVYKVTYTIYEQGNILKRLTDVFETLLIYIISQHRVLLSFLNVFVLARHTVEVFI